MSAIGQSIKVPFKEGIVLVAYSEAKRKHYLVVKPASRWLPAPPAVLQGLQGVL
jgi:hypothetical protein